MLQPRPLVFALALALTAGLAAPASQAAKATKAKQAATAQACTDFYASENAGWLKAHPMPEAGAVSALGELTASAQQQQRELLDAAMSAPKNDVQKLLGDFWASGLDDAAIDHDAAAPIAPLLKRVDAIRKSSDVAAAIAALHQVGIPVAFHFGADVDLQNLSRHLGYFNQGGIGLPDPAYYTRHDADTKALVERYTDYIRDVLRLEGVARKDLETQTALALDMERRIAELARPLQALRDPRSTYHPVPTKALGKQYKHLQLDQFLKAQGVDDATVSLANPDMFEKLDKLVASVKPSQWQAYLRWRIGDSMAPYLSKSWRDASFEFRGKVLLGLTDAPPRRQQVLDAINLAAGPMLGREYAATYLSTETHDHAVQIAKEVLATLAQNINQGSLFTGTAKAEALKKLAQLRIEVGEPQDDLDFSIQPMGRTSFGSNMLIASTWRHAQEMKRIGKSNATRRWDVLPQQPALAYDLAHNRLIVTAAMLQAPVLAPDMSTGAQYGAFGALVGHELTHAIDDSGRHVDADNNVRDWWTATDTAHWAALANNVSAHYAGAAYPGLTGVTLNAQQTQAENIADVSGLELAQAAFATAQPKASSTVERAFYAGWARLWAQQVATAEATRRAAQDVRAPGPLRTNIPAKQQAAFGAAFGCKAGSPMLPAAAKRIRIYD